MEQDEKRSITPHKNSASEVEPVIERLNGLEELLMIVTDRLMREEITGEIAVFEQQYREWQSKRVLQK